MLERKWSLLQYVVCCAQLLNIPPLQRLDLLLHKEAL